MGLDNVFTTFRSRRRRTIGKTAATLLGSAALTASATEYTINPTIGRDLAIPANWGATSLAPSDTGVIGTSGTYTLSDDLTLSQLKISGVTDQIKFNFSGHTISLSAAGHPLHVYNSAVANKFNLLLQGGVWDFAGLEANSSGNKEFRGVGPGTEFWLDNSAVITNAFNFYASYYQANSSRILLKGNSAIHCDTFTLANRDTTGARLYVQGGARISTSGTFYTDKNYTTAGTKCNNRIQISGEGSEISSASVIFGWSASSNNLDIADGGAWRATGNFQIGANTKFSATNRVAVSGGTLSASGAFFVNGRMHTCDNVFIADDHSTVCFGSVTNEGARTVFTIGDGTTMTVGGAFHMAGSGGKVTVAGGRITADGAFELKNDNVLRFELPAAGYAVNEAAITADDFVFDPTSALELDGSSGCGTATLLSLANKPASSGGTSFREWIAAQAANMDLPEGRVLTVENNGAGCNVVFGAPAATVISVR